MRQDARTYSARLGRIMPAQFQAALDRFGLGRFQQATPIPFGLFGQNVFLTSSSGEFVLRGCPHYPDQFPGERFFARLLHERTSAPVPWPYLLDLGEDIFGWSYALLPRMPGLQQADPAVRATLSPADRLAVARAMGTALSKLHALTWCAVSPATSMKTRPWPAPSSPPIGSAVRPALATSSAFPSTCCATA